MGGAWPCRSCGDGREFCGRLDQHPYELLLQLEGIAHKTTRVGRPQSNLPAAYARCAHGPRGSIERLHRTLLDEHLRVQGRTVWHETVAEMQTALDAFLLRHNRERSHQGRGMNGRTPLAGLPRWAARQARTPAGGSTPAYRCLNPTIPRGLATVRSTPSLYI